MMPRKMVTATATNCQRLAAMSRRSLVRSIGAWARACALLTTRGPRRRRGRPGPDPGRPRRRRGPLVVSKARARAHAPMLRTKLRRDMAASRWQFVAVAVTIFLGIMLYGATADAYNNLVASYHETYQDLKFAGFWSTGGDTTTFATEAKALDGVAAVDTRTVVNPPIRVGPDRFEGRVIGMPPDPRSGQGRRESGG